MVTIVILAILAIASATLLIISGKARSGFQVQKVMAYAGIFVLVFIFGGALLGIAGASPEISFWLLFFIFLIAGSVYTWLLYQWFSWAQSDLFLSELLLTLFTFSTGSAFLCLLYLTFSNVGSVAFLTGATLAFLIPFFLHKSLQLWQAVPPAYYYKWFFPTAKEVPSITFQQTIPLQFSFCKEADNEKSTTFSVVAPTDILLGDLFHSFLEEYNSQYADSPIQSYRAPFSWMFYCETGNLLHPKKVIDPDLTIIENNIKPNELVNAVRIHQ